MLMFSVDTLLIFLLIVAVATYVQTVSGFGLGMIVMGAVTVFELLPIAFTSVIISVVALINSISVMKGEFKTFDRKLVTNTALGVLPGILVGLVLLDYMSSQFEELLKSLLGTAIVLAGLVMILKPEPLPKQSSLWFFRLAGSASGVFAGMFSMGGPPLIYLFYRQPVTLKLIRLNLLAIFLVSSIARIIMVGIQGELQFDMFKYALFCLPIVVASSWVGKYYAPPISFDSMRRCAFLMLIVIGVSLIVV